MLTNFLTKIFVGKHKDPNEPKTRGKYASFASFTGIFVNLLLFAGKLTVGILSMSVAIIADAFNNIMDAGSSLVAFIGFKISNKHVDKEHPLGHGRFEYVASFIVDALIILVGFELLKSSIQKIVNPTLPSVSTITFIFLGIGLCAKLWLFFFYRKIGNTINSAPLKAAGADSLSDCIATTLVIVSAIVAKAFGLAVDGWAGVAVAAFILFTGVKAAKETIDLLLGSPPTEEFVQSIYDMAQEYSHVVGIHDVMVHDYGPGRQIVSFHAEVPSDCDINAAHEEIDMMERDMHQKLGCIVTVHLDPIVMNDPVVNEMHTIAKAAAQAIDPSFSIHDFRMTLGESTFNLIFDLVIPADCKLNEEQAENLVVEKIKQQKPNCFCVIRVEHPFV